MSHAGDGDVVPLSRSADMSDIGPIDCCRCDGMTTVQCHCHSPLTPDLMSTSPAAAPDDEVCTRGGVSIVRTYREAEAAALRAGRAVLDSILEED